MVFFLPEANANQNKNNSANHLKAEVFQMVTGNYASRTKTKIIAAPLALGPVCGLESFAPGECCINKDTGELNCTGPICPRFPQGCGSSHP